MLALVAVLAPGIFGIGQTHGVWAFRDPSGKPFWSLGVCCTDPGIEPAKFDAKNPGYVGLSHYPNSTAWADGTAKQLRSWGFNSLGGWSDAEFFKGKSAMPFFPVLHLGAYDQAPWHDMFAPQFMKAIDGAAKTQIEKLRNDPNLVGYFTDNELGWWGDTLFTSYFSMPAESPGKQRLVALIKRHYGGDFGKLAKEWTTKATDFDTLAAETKIYLRPGTNGISAVTEWIRELSTHYYRSVHDAVRRYDKRHLILGDRYCQYYDSTVAAASKRFIDVASTNLGAEWNDGTTSHFFLDTLHGLTGKPIVISEFYMAAMENNSGNRNSSGGFPVVRTQKQRAAAFTRYVEGLARKPYVIGAHWFQFYDEPSNGRGDGENYNMGLVDIHGKAYPELTSAAKEVAPPPRFPRGSKPAASAAPHRVENEEGAGGGALSLPVISPTSINDLKLWPREKALIPAKTPNPIADLYAVKDAAGKLHLGLFAMDFADPKLYEGGKIPEADRPVLRITAGGKTITIRYGGDRPATCSDPSVKVREKAGVKHTLLIELPFRKGLSATLQTHARAQKVTW